MVHVHFVLVDGVAPVLSTMRIIIVVFRLMERSNQQRTALIKSIFLIFDIDRPIQFVRILSRVLRVQIFCGRLDILNYTGRDGLERDSCTRGAIQLDSLKRLNLLLKLLYNFSLIIYFL